MMKKRREGLELVSNPRLVAFRALEEVELENTPEDALAKHGLILDPRDHSLATALVYEVLRHRLYLDDILTSKLATGRGSDALKQVLRLGLAQLLYFDRLGEHAVVMETVTLAKIVAPGRHNVVNAILRGILRDRDAGGLWPPTPTATGDPTHDLSIKYSCPHWWAQRITNMLGPEEAELFFQASIQSTPPTIRINPLKTTRNDLKDSLPFSLVETPISPWGLTLSSFAGRPDSWPGYSTGDFAIQDEASQLLGLLAPLEPQQTVLDACAGLGGKALLLASLFPTATVVAMDKDPAKLEALQQEAHRLTCQDNLQMKASDLLITPPAPETYDIVLIDAPCAGLGVMRRRPDLKWNKNPNDISRLADLQLDLLNAAASAVKLNGRLIYGVCSLTPEEGPLNVQKFLSQRPDFKLLALNQWPPQLQPFVDPSAGLTLWPHRHKTDGFFWSILIRHHS
ncbi:MAG: RsmB/NOP family class I SAM-dependent RNA methyltransferase [Candidatus Adiutrix sp.]